MGAVYKARQITMQRIVALKILPPSLAKQPTFTERFLREARASARLSHPNIVSGIDVGEDKGVYYFAMELVDGPSARGLICKDGLPEEQVLKIGKAVALALAHAHAHGILHRDIKPDNILIDKDGTPKLCDLGLARLDSQTDSEKVLTQEGKAVGTPHYISPEQARGQRDLDAKTDLYSLGATMYHMLTGKTMFDGNNDVDVMTRHVTDKCPAPNDAGARASKGLVAVLAKLLTKARADRYASAAQLAEDLDLLLQGRQPRHADLPPAKWPFSGGAPGFVARKAGTIGQSAALEKPRTAHREGQPSASLKAGWWLVPVGIAIAGLLTLMMFLGRKEQPPPTAPDNAAQVAPLQTDAKAPQPNPSAVSPEDLKHLFDAAEDFAKKNPASFSRAIAEFEKVRTTARGTEFERKAEDAAAAISKRGDEAAGAAAQKFAAGADALAAEGKYDSAIAVWEKLPAEQAEWLAPRAAKAIAGLRSQAEARLKTVLDEAGKCLAERRWADGKKGLDAAASVEYRAWDERLQEARNKLAAGAQAEAEGARDAALAAANAAFSRHLDAFVAVTLKGDLKAARRIAADAKADPSLNGLAARTRDLSDACEALEKAGAARTAALAQLKDGKERTFETAKEPVTGVVSAVTADEITIQIQIAGGGGNSAGKRIPLADLTPEERRRLAGGFKPETPAEHLAQGICALGAGDIQAATSELGAAKEYALTPPFQAKLDELVLGALEGAAKSAWEAIVRAAGAGKVSDQKAKEISEKLGAFEKEHGKTAFAVSIAAELASLKDRMLTAEGGGKTLSLDLGGGVKMELVLVKAGEFEMGSNDGDPRENPVHKVKISKPFYIGKYHVTVAQFRRFVEATKYETEAEKPPFVSVTFNLKGNKMQMAHGNWRDPGFKQEDNHPVVVVCWKDAQGFSKWATGATRRTVRLPTEAEWEYAARGPQNLRYPWGDKWDGTLVNHADVSLKKAGFPPPGREGFGNEDDGYAFTSPVGAYKNASWCGAYDMAGNVWQCCEDLLKDKYYAESSPVDPPGPASSGAGPAANFHVLRGGSWLQPAVFCRGAARDPPNLHHTGCCAHYGFRVVVESAFSPTP